LKANGIYNNAAIMQGSTWSGVGWANIATGVFTDKHNVTDNSNVGSGNYANYPTFFSRIESAKPHLNTFYSYDWSGLGFAEANVDTVASFVSTPEYSDADREVNVATVAALTSKITDYDVLFSYYGNVDIVGHEHGHGVEYTTAVKEVDTYVGNLVAAIKQREHYSDEEWIIIVSTDHGHVPAGGDGGNSNGERDIFYIISGDTVPNGTSTVGGHETIVPTILDHVQVPYENTGLEGIAIGTHTISNECGNNVIEIAETCDDGNTVDGDGCSSACHVEHVKSNDIRAVFTAGSQTTMFLRNDDSIAEHNHDVNRTTSIKLLGMTEEYKDIAPYANKITAAITWGEKRYYFMSDGNYLRQNSNTGIIGSSYPKGTGSHWPGLSGYGNLITAASLIGDKAYLFLSTGEYLRYDMKEDRLDAGYPKSTSLGWPGLGDYAQEIIGAHNYGNGYMYFFLTNKRYLKYHISGDYLVNSTPQVLSDRWINLEGEIEVSTALHPKASWVDVNGSVSILRNDGFLIEEAQSTSIQKSLLRDTIPALAPYWNQIVGAYDNKSGYTYFFMSNGQYIRMNTATKDIGNYPRSISYQTWPGVGDAATKISAALYYDENTLYLFLNNGQYLKYSLPEDKVIDGYPKSTSHKWPGLGGYGDLITAAVRTGEKAHIFAGTDYFDYSVANDSVSSSSIISDSVWASSFPQSTDNLTIAPFLQLPSSSSMTVRFETNAVTSTGKVYYRKYQSGSFSAFPASRDVSSASFLYATIDGLEADTRYDYYVEVSNPLTGYTSTTDTFHFTTYPESTSKEKFHILALSDTQNNGTLGVLKNIADAVGDYHCGSMDNCDQKLRAITISGDVVDYGSSLGQWRTEFFGQLKDLTPYVPLVPAPGNHDYYGDGELSTYRSMFMLPVDGYQERYYTLQIANTRLISLDSYKISNNHGSYSDTFRNQQHGWLKGKLDSYKNDANTDIVLALFHHGCLSAIWIPGESLGSCDNVAALELFTKETGKRSGHLFGHTHAYSRGVSRDIDHLWLNTASAAGYREHLYSESFRAKTRNYDTFSISSSQFGFTILTLNGESKGELKLQRYRATVTSKGGGYASVSPVFDEHYDELNIKDDYIEAPTPSQSSMNVETTSSSYVEIDSNVKSLVNEVQWQFSTSEAFLESDLVNVWGQITRKKHIWYQNNDTVEGLDIDTQANANIFKLNLGLVDGKHFEQDEQRKWDKGWMTTFQSTYSPYQNGKTPNIINFSSGNTYYWRARVRDAHMNWSEWSTSAQFTMQ